MKMVVLHDIGASNLKYQCSRESGCLLPPSDLSITLTMLATNYNTLYIGPRTRTDTLKSVVMKRWMDGRLACRLDTAPGQTGREQPQFSRPGWVASGASNGQESRGGHRSVSMFPPCWIFRTSNLTNSNSQIGVLEVLACFLWQQAMTGPRCPPEPSDLVASQLATTINMHDAIIIH